jgi:hypothetical protein
VRGHFFPVEELKVHFSMLLGEQNPDKIAQD